MEHASRGIEQRFQSREPERLHTSNIDIPGGSLVLMIGLPGSGKSTFAREQFPAESIVSTDDLRGELTNNVGNLLQSAEAFTIARTLVESRLKQGHVAVVDAMNLDVKSRANFLEIARKLGLPTIGIHVNPDAKTLLERDAQRTKNVEATVLRHKMKKMDVDQLYRDPLLDKIFVIDDKSSDAKVALPEAEARLRESEQDFYAVAHRAESDVFAYIESQRERREQSEVPKIAIEPRSINFLDDSEAARTFLEQNTLGTQVLDLDFLAKRLGVEKGDDLVTKTAERLLALRADLNLVSFVIGSQDQEKTKATLVTKLGENAPMNQMDVPDEILKTGVMEINRGDLADERLLVLGDIHGALSTIHHMHKLVAEEAQENPDLPQRKLVFVGDIPDRGPNKAQSVMAVAGLVKSGRAEWILGNHDDHLKEGLHAVQDAFAASGKDWKTWLKEDCTEDFLKTAMKIRETRATLRELMGFLDTVDKETGNKTGERPFLAEHAFENLLAVLDKAPVYKEWRDLVVVHAAMTHIPENAEAVTDDDRKRMLMGVKRDNGAVSEVIRLRKLAAKDPDRVIVGGHTHDPGVQHDTLSGTVGLDDDGPEIHGLLFPEMKYVSHAEPYFLELARMMKEQELPNGIKLLDLMNFLESHQMIKTNGGVRGTEFEDLTVITYHEMTELNDLWNQYPVLRHFRGLIVDKEGHVVARPFRKTHKAGVEIPLEQLDILPEKVFEKANGSLGICYFWKGAWRISTKFSLQNEGYTDPAQKMLHDMDTSTMKPENTYLFEIILPEDSHVVDYAGEPQLVLLNVVDKETGTPVTWDEVAETANVLGTRTAIDMTKQFEGKTIAEIYQIAQTEGSFENIEGFMAVYHDAVTGEETTVKVKAVEYDNKKFVRDKLDWDKLFEKFDWIDQDISPAARAKLISYKRDSEFVNEAFEARIQWIRDEICRLKKDFVQRHESIIESAIDVYTSPKYKKKTDQQRLDLALREVLHIFESREDLEKFEKQTILAYVRNIISGSDDPIGKRVRKDIEQRIKDETRKRGQNAFWLTPDTK